MLEVRIAAYPGEDLPDVQQRFRDALVDAVRDDPWLAEHPPEVTFYAFQADGFILPADAPIMQALAARTASCSATSWNTCRSPARPTRACSTSTTTCPATCYGPIGGNLHAPDEWVDLESVRQVTKVLAATAMDWCGVA